jgi:formylglycine-generating enzyme required for sulfatase activity
MATSYPTLGIAQSGSPGSYSYSVTGSDSQGVNCPIFDVSWGDAARFCNWLQNSQGTATTVAGAYALTETGAYAMSGATSNAQLMAVPSPSHSGSDAATYFLPTENEWYKAAYYVGGGTNAGYWIYPTQSNTGPSNVLSATGTNNANWYNGATDPTNLLTPVGSFALSPGPYGTYDMGGDVFQWNETDVSDMYGSYRGVRCGSWSNGSINLESCVRDYDNPTALTESSSPYGLYGFRVASSEAVPEPSTFALLGAGGLGLLAYAWRRRRAA